MDINILGATFVLQILMTVLKYASSMPTFWCPIGRYPTEGGRCELCFENCGSLGCTGPGSYLGPGGCSSCWLGLETNRGNTTCMSPFSSCPSGSYRKAIQHNGHHMTMCKACHPLCETCSGPGISYCDTCKFYRWDNMCVRRCPSNSIVRTRRRTCITFHSSYGRRRPFYLYRERYRDQS